MGFDRYLLGLALLGAMLSPLAVAARTARTRLVAEWSGAQGLVADAVAVIAVLLAVSHVLGAAGQFGPVALVVGCGAAGSAIWLAARRLPEPGPVSAPPPPGVSRAELAVAGGATAIAVSMWSTWVAQAARFGIENRDSVWYHLPIAAHFVQHARLTDLQFLNSEALVTYYPADGSVVHAIGMVAFHRDDLSLLLNFALLPVFFAAAWAIGQRWQVGPAALAGASTVLALPVVAGSQPGTANDDVLSVTMLLAAIACLVHAPDRGRGRAVAFGLSGLAAGAALGTKLTMLIPVAVVGVGVVLWCGRRSRAAAGAWWSGTLLAGSFWYLRNLVAVGNPVPSVGLDLGPIRLPSPPTPSIERYGSAVAELATRSDAWGQVFRPGLNGAFSAAWPLVLLLTAAGLMLAVRARERAKRIAAAAALALVVVFVFVPGTAFAANLVNQAAPRHTAELIFAYNLRYVLAALVLGFVLLPTDKRLRTGTARWLVLGSFALVLLVVEVSDSGLRGWSPGHSQTAVWAAVATGVVFWLVRGRLGAGGVGTRQARRRNRRLLVAVGVGSLVLLLVGAALSERYHDDRYASNQLGELARRLPAPRIAIAGFTAQYPLLGDDLSKRVATLGVRDAEGSFRGFTECRGWRRALHRGRFDYIVTPTTVATPTLGYDLARWRLGDPRGEPPNEPRESAWNRSDPRLRELFERGGATVYAVEPGASYTGCP
jgi:hypothetical protein